MAPLGALTARLQQMAVDQTALHGGDDLHSGFPQRFPCCRGRLAEAWQAYSVWSRASPHVTRLGLDHASGHDRRLHPSWLAPHGCGTDGRSPWPSQARRA